MVQKTKIGIVGLGGVGGYFGGILAEFYAHHPHIEVILIARPSTKEIIEKKGLQLILPDQEKMIHPKVISSCKDESNFDYLICATKSYDLEQSFQSIQKCIGPETVILSLLNGVDAPERIEKIFPMATVWKGCAYLVSRRTSPGVIVKTGKVHSLHFGAENKDPRLIEFNRILFESGIEARLSMDIKKTIWEKFIFISSLASLTSYLNLSVGKIFESENNTGMLVELLKEVTALAKAKNISFADDIVNTTISKMKLLPYDTTSSMHSDYLSGNQTEYLSLTEYVVNEAKKTNIKTPLYQSILQDFQARK